MGQLDGKVAIVTGAGGGLGRAHALLLAHEGAQVVVNDLGGDRHGAGGGTSMADGVVDEINAAGGSAVAHYGSVTDDADAAGMVKTAVDTFGRLDILINNAGILRDKSFKNMSDDEWDIVIDVHLRGTYLVTKHAWQQMLNQGQGGRIVMTSSTSGLIGNFGQANYGAAKAGLVQMAKSLGNTWAQYGIRANNVAAGMIESRMTLGAKNIPEFNDEVIRNTPLMRWGKPEDIANAVLFLCSEQAGYITGQTLVSDGGRTIWIS